MWIKHKNLIDENKIDKKLSGKAKEDAMNEKKQELEKRLQDVSIQLGTTSKKAAKKGEQYSLFFFCKYSYIKIIILF